MKIEEKIAKHLKDKYTISTAESCTGGYLSHLITSVSGSSNYYKGSVISYWTEVKINILQVNKLSVKEHTVVSSEVAKQMSIGIKNKLKTDFSISTTGVAGPSKGEDGKAVGTVFVAISTPNKTTAYELKIIKNRKEFIRKVSKEALKLLKKEIENYIANTK